MQNQQGLWGYGAVSTEDVEGGSVTKSSVGKLIATQDNTFNSSGKYNILLIYLQLNLNLLLLAQFTSVSCSTHDILIVWLYLKLN